MFSRYKLYSNPFLNADVDQLHGKQGSAASPCTQKRPALYHPLVGMSMVRGISFTSSGFNGAVANICMHHEINFQLLESIILSELLVSLRMLLSLSMPPFSPFPGPKASSYRRSWPRTCCYACSPELRGRQDVMLF